MQYISSFFGLAGPSASNPNVFMFDSKEESTLPVVDLTSANVLARRARSILSFNGFLNTIRGRKENKYYMCPLKYTRLRSALIQNDTDIVSQTGQGTLSGMATVAETQSYSLGLGADTTIYLALGTVAFEQNDTHALTFPPVRFSDTNCPYGQSGTARIGFRYLIEGGNQFDVIATCSGGVPACSSTQYAPAFPSVVSPIRLLQTTMSASIQGYGGGGTPNLTQGTTTDKGSMYQSQVGADETVTIDSAFCYLNEFRAFVKFSSLDFTPVSASPGTCPRIRFKVTTLSGI